MARTITMAEMENMLNTYKTTNKGKYLIWRYLASTRTDTKVYMDEHGFGEYEFEVLTADVAGDGKPSQSAAELCYTDNKYHARKFYNIPTTPTSGGYGVMVWDDDQGEYVEYIPE